MDLNLIWWHFTLFQELSADVGCDWVLLKVSGERWPTFRVHWLVTQVDTFGIKVLCRFCKIFTNCMRLFKETVHPKMGGGGLLSHDGPNPYDFFSIKEHIGRSAKCLCLYSTEGKKKSYRLWTNYKRVIKKKKKLWTAPLTLKTLKIDWNLNDFEILFCVRVIPAVVNRQSVLRQY